MLRSVDEFVGRREDIDWALTRVGAATPQSVSLIGERRMGKSSLLWHLSQQEIHGQYVTPSEYLFVYFDCQGHQSGEEDFCSALGEHLHEAADDRLSVPDCGTVADVDRAVHALDQAGHRLVLLLDEFEAITRSGLFGPEFFGALRSVAGQYGVALVTASRRPLHELCYNDDIRQSAFFNIFAARRIGAMSDADIHTLIEQPSAAAKVPLAPHAECLLRLGGHLPFFMQIACCAAFEQLVASDSETLDPVALDAAVMEEGRAHFEYLWGSFDDDQRATALAIAQDDPAAAEPGDGLETLSTAGFVETDGALRPRLFSTAFTSFLQRMSGSRPPVISRRRTVAAAISAVVLLGAVALATLQRTEPDSGSAPASSPQQGRASRASSGLEEKLQPLPGHLRLAEISLGDLYASQQARYAKYPAGRALVVNEGADTMVGIVSLDLPDYLRRAWLRPVRVVPGGQLEIDLLAPLDPAVLALTDVVETQAIVSLIVDDDDGRRGSQAAVPVTLHGRGALSWEAVECAAAFITVQDPHVAAFARSALAAFATEAGSLGDAGRNLQSALILLEALRGHGVRYVADANRPVDRQRTGERAVDHIQYPAEVLSGRTGDCDDLTVLYAALLENAGIHTALVDLPEHVLLLVGAGVPRHEAHLLPVREDLLVVWGESLWLPVEVTRLADGFMAAWQAGADQLAELSSLELRRRAATTAGAWQRYPPANPDFHVQVDTPGRDGLLPAVLGQRAALEAMVDDEIERRYLRPLSLHPQDDGLWSRLARTYASLRRFDLAIESAYRHLDVGGANVAATCNDLGIGYSLRGDLTQAKHYFGRAMELAPEAAGYRRNFERVAGGVRRDMDRDVEPQGRKARTGELTPSSFYWYAGPHTK